MSDPKRTARRAGVQARHERSRLPKIRALGESISFHDDLYPFILKLSWTAFFAFITALFILVNVAFALLYMAAPHCVTNASSFLDHFFFSVETLATIGYGEMSPNNDWAHSVMTIESLTGVAGTAMITGLTFVRFARPTAQILFSDRMVIGPRDAVPHLMFRMANQRQNQIADAQVRVILLVNERTLEGESIRRPMRLELVRDTNPMFALSWTAMHRIDAKSPFHGEDALERLREQGAEVFLSLSGFDETLMQTITARWRYDLDHIVKNARFVDVLSRSDDGTRTVDYDKFHEILPIEQQRQEKA